LLAGLKKRIILKGTADQIASAIIQIEDKVQEEVEAQLRIQVAVTRMSKSKLSLDNINIKNTIDNYPDVETYQFLVPHEACGRIIGRNGYTVQEMERSSGAKIMIENITNKFESMHYFNISFTICLN